MSHNPERVALFGTWFDATPLGLAVILSRLPRVAAQPWAELFFPVGEKKPPPGADGAGLSTILSRIVTLDSQEPRTGTVKQLGSVLDFACGSGSLLLNIRKQLKASGGNIGKIYGQEKNITTYNLARMNMLLHGVKDTEFEIYHGDTLTNDWDFLRETNPAKMPKFDAVVTNPPFSYRWEPKDDMSDDVRFKNYGLAPKTTQNVLESRGMCVMDS
jgi:methylase of polypeptide subunit release factors